MASKVRDGESGWERMLKEMMGSGVRVTVVKVERVMPLYWACCETSGVRCEVVKMTIGAGTWRITWRTELLRVGGGS